MYTLGIDPGTEFTAYCVIDEQYKIQAADKVRNDELLEIFGNYCHHHIVVESLQSYGQAVGREVFETAYFIGRIMQRAKDYDIPYTLYPRPEYAKAICGAQRISDSILRQALLLRFGDDKKGGPLFQLKGNSDKRSAFAIAAYHLDKVKMNREG